MIKLAIKTQTRRIDNGRRTMIPGKTYPANDYIFATLEESLIIKCERAWKEPVRKISKEDALAEGLYTPTMYKRLWIRMNGDLDTPAQCFKFSYLMDSKDPNYELLHGYLLEDYRGNYVVYNVKQGGLV